MKFIDTSIIFDNGTYTTDKTSFKYEDIDFSYTDSKVLIKANHTKIFKIKLNFAFSPSVDALFLGDAFERSYGNLEWKKAADTARMPWYFIVNDNDRNYCFGVKTKPNAFCFWHFKNDIISLELDIRSGTNPVALCGRTLDVCTIVTDEIDGCSFQAQKQFCKKK